MKITITDNVLSDEDYPITELRFNSRGHVSAQIPIKEALYSFPDMIGWSLEDIYYWLQYDPTGQHPEIYHEVVQ